MLLKSKAIAFKSLGLVVLFATMSSFSGSWGGDHYRIYVNNKLVMEEFVHNQKSIKSISLDQRSQNDQVSVYYSHCGKVGQARQLIIKDGKNQVLKQWSYADVKSEESPMTCKGKDILNLQKVGGDKLNLFYSSKEIPAGKRLAVVNIGGDSETRP
ncbi:MAG TPA: hypothetical protein VGD17_19610 [Chitinophagaceae bacterium]